MQHFFMRSRKNTQNLEYPHIFLEKFSLKLMIVKLLFKHLFKKLLAPTFITDFGGYLKILRYCWDLNTKRYIPNMFLFFVKDNFFKSSKGIKDQEKRIIGKTYHKKSTQN